VLDDETVKRMSLNIDDTTAFHQYSAVSIPFLTIQSAVEKLKLELYF